MRPRASASARTGLRLRRARRTRRCCPPEPRRARRRIPRPWRAGRRRRTCCGRLRGARRSARRTAPAPARRSRSRDRRRRRIRADWRAARPSHAPFRVPSDGPPCDRRCRKLSRISSAGADGDRAVGDVEGRERPAIVVEQQEVDDLAQRRGGPRDCRARRRGSAPGPGSRSRRRRAAGARRSGPLRRWRSRRRTTAATRRAGEEAERGTRVEREHQAEKVGERHAPRPAEGRASIAAFVAWSATITAALTQQPPRPAGTLRSKSTGHLRKAPRLAGAEEIGHAAPAHRRMRGIGADVGAVMPAALAFSRAHSG